MKTILKTTIIFCVIFFAINSYSQVTVTMSNMQYINGTQISDCGEIDFESNSQVSVQFTVNLSKQQNFVVGAGTIRAYYKKTAANNKEERGAPYSVPDNFATSFTASLPITLDANDFNISGGAFFVEYTSTISTLEYTPTCSYSVIKDQVPTFTMPTSTSVSCNSTSAKTFTVNNVYNSPGNLSFNWEVGNGWERNGSSVSNFTTTSSTISLVPTSYPPSSVRVTPVLDGVSYPKLTTTISLSSFNPSYQITGSSSICGTSNYTIDNLPNNISILSVSSSNSNVATVSLNNSEIIVTKVADGLATISAVLQNSCSQTATITKDIQIGIPTYVNNATITGGSAICGTQLYTYSVNVPNHPCINGLNWSVSPNINIISQNYNTITVSRNLTNTENAGFISVEIPNTDIQISKGIKVGLPNSNLISVQNIGSVIIYSGQWFKLKASYTSFLYDVNSPFNNTYEWSIPNSQVRNLSNPAYKDVNPNTIGLLNIGVRVSNECGCSDWKYTPFNVIYDGSNGGPKDFIKI